MHERICTATCFGSMAPGMIRAIMLDDSPYLLHGLWTMAHEGRRTTTCSGSMAPGMTVTTFQIGAVVMFERI